jgi:glycosyltransferase involved in cell wall biosynthesis
MSVINKQKSGISVVILAHERQEETMRAVDAILKVNFGCETEIVVSDNPSTPEKIIKNLPSQVLHKVRNPSGGGLWHYNQVLQEADHEWTLLTHDDDEILPHLGDLFRQYSLDSEVIMITGKSRILVNGVETADQGYSARLKSAGLDDPSPVSRTDLFDSLFDIGPLFPASAMIVRTGHLKNHATINPDFDLAGDLALSMALANNAKVIFDGSTFVMNYHIHGGNSVFSTRAAGGLMADFTIVRLSEAVSKNLVITRPRQVRLIKTFLVSRILAKSFHLNDRYSNVRSYALEFNKKFPKKKIGSLYLLPIPLGPLKPIARRLMWKRLGVDRWGYK